MREHILIDNEFALPSGQAVRVMYHMAVVMDYTNIVWDTHDEIANSLKVSSRTVSRCIKELVESNIIKRHMDRVYMVNPGVVRKDVDTDENMRFEILNELLEGSWGDE